MIFLFTMIFQRFGGNKRKRKRQNHRRCSKTTVQNRLGFYLTGFEKFRGRKSGFIV
jgi:hypothetical protein